MKQYMPKYKQLAGEIAESVSTHHLLKNTFLPNQNAFQNTFDVFHLQVFLCTMNNEVIVNV